LAFIKECLEKKAMIELKDDNRIDALTGSQLLNRAKGEEAVWRHILAVPRFLPKTVHRDK